MPGLSFKVIIIYVMIGALTTVFIALTNAGTYLHELAHKGVAHLLYIVTSDELHIRSFVRALRRGEQYGAYTYTAKGLSPLGKYLGGEASSAFVLIAGPLFDAFIALGLYLLGSALYASYPNVTVILRTSSIVYFFSVLNHVRAALLHGTGDLYNFSQKIHINPTLTALAFSVSLPIAVTFLYFLYRR